VGHQKTNIQLKQKIEDLEA